MCSIYDINSQVKKVEEVNFNDKIFVCDGLSDEFDYCGKHLVIS